VYGWQTTGDPVPVAPLRKPGLKPFESNHNARIWLSLRSLHIGLFVVLTTNPFLAYNQTLLNKKCTDRRYFQEIGLWDEQNEKLIDFTKGSLQPIPFSTVSENNTVQGKVVISKKLNKI